MISPDNEQYENRSRLLRYHYKQEPLRMQQSSEAEYKRLMLQQVLQPAAYPEQSSGVLFVGC